MSRVIDGGNVATNYIIFASQLGEYFGSLLKGEECEMPGAFLKFWRNLFDSAEDAFYFDNRDGDLKPEGREPNMRNFPMSFAARRLLLDSYMKSGAALDIDDDRKIVVEVRDLTSLLLKEKRLPAVMIKQCEFLRDFYRILREKGNDDRYCELGSSPGRYSFGTQDFDDD